MNKKRIEFACSHNHGRSPLAEAFAKEYFASIDMPGYEVVSSGTRVEEINSMLEGTVPISEKDSRFILKKALARNVVSDPAEVKRLLALDSLNPAEMTALQGHGRYVLNRFVQEEHTYRTEAFKLFGLGDPKPTHDQTVFHPYSKLWLGMGSENVDFANDRLYTPQSRPVIDTLAGYALRTPGTAFNSAFGGTLADYLNMAEVIKNLTVMSMNRAMDEI